MSYFTDDENEELASLKRQFETEILDAAEFKDAKAVILEAAKKRRTGDVRPEPSAQLLPQSPSLRAGGSSSEQ